MSIELLIDFNQFWSRLGADIRSAQESVFVQTFAFEGDAVGKQLSAALVSSPATDKRILADSFTRVVLTENFAAKPAPPPRWSVKSDTPAWTSSLRTLSG